METPPKTRHHRLIPEPVVATLLFAMGHILFAEFASIKYILAIEHRISVNI
jgi:hypothetical protein